MNNYCDYITADLLKELIDHNFPAYKYSVGGYDGKTGVLYKGFV